MKSHEFITKNFDKLDQDYQPRDPGFDGNNKPGDHTDDAAMSQGSFSALVNGRGVVTMNTLRDAWNAVYREDRIRFVSRGKNE